MVQSVPPPPPGFRIVGQGAPAAPTPARQAPRPAAPRPQVRFADDRDALIRTVIGEARGEPEVGRQAVAAVIQNRARSRGLTPQQVVLEANQFEPWGNPDTARELMAIQPNDPLYREVSQQIESVLAGNDPTGGASHFYAPEAQAALGRQKPAWDNGSGRAIGRHLFFSLEGGQPQAAAVPPPPAGFQIVQQQEAAAQSVKDWENRGSRSPLEGANRFFNRPWLRGTPRYVEGEPGGVNADGEPIVMRAGVIELDDGGYEIYDPATDAYYRATADQFDTYKAQQAKERNVREARIEREADPEYQEAFADAQRRADSNPDLLKAITAGPTLEASREIDAFGAGLETKIGNLFKRATGQEVRYGSDMASQAVRDVERDRSNVFLQEHPAQAIGGRLFGGLFTPGLKSTGGFIARGQGVDRLARAGLVGAGYGAGAGLFGAEGDLSERLDDAAVGGLTGYGVGAVGQRAVDGLLAGAARSAANPSAQRQLSQAGVDLTPGQMAGGAAQRVEEGLQSWPVLGDSIKTARNRNMATFDRAAINEALEPIGKSVSSGGRDAVRDADAVLSAEYARILDPLTYTPSPQLHTEMQAALNPANLSRNARQRLGDTVADVRSRLQGLVSGRDLKQIESELTGLIKSAEAGGAEGKALVQPLRATRDALRDDLRRQHPQVADDLAAANAAYANFDRVRRAAANPATARNDGLFSAGNLNSVLARSEGRAYARGEGRLQGLTDNGVAVLGDKVPDSGTPFRSLLQVATPGAAGLAVAGRSDVLTITALITGLGSIGYGQTAQRLLNAAYRSTDPGAVKGALAELSRYATQNPAVLPYYEAAVQLLMPEPQPSRGGLLSPQQSSPRGLLATQ